MRNRIILLAFAVLCLVGVSGAFAQTSGGPDFYGYVWRTDADPQGPTYVWNSIKGAPGATQITGLTDDNSVAALPIGWTFHYYWTDNTTFKVGSNGWVSFNNVSNIASCFPLIPTQGGAADNYLAPFMSDLIYTYTGTVNPAEVWWWSNNVDTLIVEYNQVPWWINTAPDWAGSNTFQVILSGQDSSITFMYNDTDVANWTDNSGCNADMEIGIENVTGNIGLEVFNEALPADQSAIKFYFPQVITFTAPDATPAWNANVDNAGQFFISGAGSTPQDMLCNVANVGNAPITANVAVAGDIRLPGAGAAFWTSTSTVSGGLAAGASQNVTFPAQVTFTAANHYSYKVTTTVTGDINPSNNQNTVEIVTAPCVGDSMNLTYSSAVQNDGLVAWSGGQNDEGAGIYVIPPAYPANINNIDVWIGDVTTSQPGVHDPFHIAIYDDNGFPGTRLDSVTVPANASAEQEWYRVRMNGTSTITSGGWYIAWYQGGGDVFLGTETQAPISRRTYEILGGQWAGYRESTINDFMMSANITVTCPNAISTKEEVNTALKLRAVPNPTSGATSLRFDLPVLGDVKVNVVNMFGQTIFSQSEIGVAAGTHILDIDAQNWAGGLYFVNLESTSGSMTTKLVVNH